MSAPEVRVLTVRQPWAWAIVHGGKDVENRVRNLAGDYRGLVAIHVALKRDGAAGDAPIFTPLMTAANEFRRARPRPLLPGESETPWFSDLGAIIGVVRLMGVHDSRGDGCGTRKGTARLGDLIPLCSEWADPWAHHLVIADARPLAEPMPFRGALHLQKTTPEVAAEILRRLS